jgi:erythronate-4-phosphate dehydrogenase
MYRIIIDNHIPYIDEYFKHHFIIQRYQHVDELYTNISDQDILVCRSTTVVDEQLLQHASLKIVATASSGTNHIHKKALKNKKIQFFSGHGANANAVCDYVTSTFGYLLSNSLLSNPRVAIIGYGAVGQKVYHRLSSLGFECGVYDPFISDIPHQIQYQEQLKDYTVICLHPNYHKQYPFPSHHLIDQKLISTLDRKACIINVARGEIVDENAILSSCFKGLYCTDVYLNEPNINPEIIARSTLCTPHIAGHSLDSKKRMTAIISQQIHRYLELPIPSHVEKKANQELIHIQQDWITHALKQYNPILETQQLKQNPCANQFLSLRRAHHFRHDFPWQF